MRPCAGSSRRSGRNWSGITDSGARGRRTRPGDVPPLGRPLWRTPRAQDAALGARIRSTTKLVVGTARIRTDTYLRRSLSSSSTESKSRCLTSTIPPSRPAAPLRARSYARQPAGAARDSFARHRPARTGRDPTRVTAGAGHGSAIRARAAMRVKHLSVRTEEAYLGWMRRYYEFHGRKDPATLGAAELSAFLSSLATERKVAASTQNQALAALLFLYRSVLGQEFPWLDDLVRARGPERLPVVLSRDEVRAVLSSMDGVTRLMATLLYGSGLRLLECCLLRVKDVDFARRQIVVRRGKGDKDRMTMLPAVAASELAAHLSSGSVHSTSGIAVGAGSVELPDALARKLPSAGREWPWQWVFPATRGYADRETGQRRRHHLHETVVQQAVRRSVLASEITKRATCHTFRIVRNPSTRGRQRHPDGAGAAGAQGRGDDDDLHARPEPRSWRGAEPGRPAAIGCRPTAWEGAVMSRLRPRGRGHDSRIRQTCRSGDPVAFGRRRALVRARDPGVRESAMTELDRSVRCVRGDRVGLPKSS